MRVLNHEDHGFVLVVVLILLMGISALLVGYMKTSLSAAREVRVTEHIAGGRVLAKSGIYRTFAAINDPSDPFERMVSSQITPYRWLFGGEQIELNLENEAGKIDINNSRLELITGYLYKTGVKPEHRDYVNQLVSRARETGNQLALEDVYWPLLLYSDWPTFHRNFTVRNTRGKVDIGSASELVLSAVPDITSEQVDRIILARSSGAALPAIRSEFLGSGGDIYTITALVLFTPTRRFYMRLPIKVFSSGRAEALTSPHI